VPRGFSVDHTSGWKGGRRDLMDGDCKRNVCLETYITSTESEEGFDCMCAQ